MADVTFGVKVPEEMKNELSEIMKDTQLTGKEFMGLLLSTYKLERNKDAEQLFTTDIEELQRLLQRIQNIYLNVNERAAVFLEEQLAVKTEEIKEIQKEEEVYKEEIESLKGVVQQKEAMIKAEQERFKEKAEEIAKVQRVVEEYSVQIQQSRTLSEQYEANICGLKARILELERFELEIQQRVEENQKLQTRNDELASDVWFLQREKEKIEIEKERELEKKEEEINKLKEQYELELKNSLLEQKLTFNHKIDLLKEEHYKNQQIQNERIQEILMNKNSADS